LRDQPWHSDTQPEKEDTMKAWSSIAAAAILALLGFFAGGGPTWAAEVKVLSSNAMTDVMTDLVPEFERTTGHKVVATYEPTNAILTRLKAGEPADVVVLLRQSIDELKMTGKVVPGSEVDLAKTSLGIAVRAGAPKPDISTAEAFKEAMLKARSVALSEVGASGIQFRRVLERLGIAEAMRPKLKVLPGATRTADLVAKGDAEIAVQMMSELQAVPGVQIVGPLPGALHYEILLTAALDAGAKEPAAGTALIKFLASPSVSPVLKKKGMEGA
jgi:molybdate transport system substrate-binding protein